jgi:hypothetical protein
VDRTLHPIIASVFLLARASCPGRSQGKLHLCLNQRIARIRPELSPDVKKKLNCVGKEM